MRHTSVLLASLLVAATASAGVVVTADRASDDKSPFAVVPAPVKDDLAAEGKWKLIDGRPDSNGGEFTLLTDGQAAESADDPSAAFFFDAGTSGGRFRLDLGTAKAVGQINSYSWHTDTRAPQVYKIYVSDGTDDAFDPEPKLFVDPEMAGWKLLASVDSRPKGGDEGGRHGVCVTDDAGKPLGTFRYVLFDVARTENESPFGNTFYSEIDVIAADKTKPIDPAKLTAAKDAAPLKIVIDTTGLDDEMTKWAHEKLEPVCQQWYPKIVEMLPSEGYTAPRTFTIVFKTDMGGTPAAAQGNRVMCNLEWFKNNKDGEGVGAVVHEMVHVVQQYKFGRKSVPFWLQEGIPDYIRWFLYEPEKNGARVRNPDTAKYDNAYRISANFLNWATQTYDKDLVKKLNAVIRQGTYKDEIWKDLTGKTLDELDAEWKTALKKN